MILVNESVGKIVLHLKVVDFVGLVHFEWHSQNEVDNMDVFVL